MERPCIVTAQFVNGCRVYQINDPVFGGIIQAVQSDELPRKPAIGKHSVGGPHYRGTGRRLAEWQKKEDEELAQALDLNC